MIAFFLFIERHAILEARATACLDENTKLLARFRLLRVETVNLLNRAVRELNHGKRQIALTVTVNQVRTGWQGFRFYARIRQPGQANSVLDLQIGLPIDKFRFLVPLVTQLKHIFNELHYELVRVIAEGGMGVVYEALQNGADQFEKQVAIKLIREEY